MMILSICLSFFSIALSSISLYMDFRHNKYNEQQLRLLNTEKNKHEKALKALEEAFHWELLDHQNINIAEIAERGRILIVPILPQQQLTEEVQPTEVKRSNALVLPSLIRRDKKAS